MFVKKIVYFFLEISFPLKSVCYVRVKLLVTVKILILKHTNKINPSSSSASSTSSVSSTRSSSIQLKTKKKSKLNPMNYVHKRRSTEIMNNSKIIIGTDGKQIRPKRGQYRRYESEPLSNTVSSLNNSAISM